MKILSKVDPEKSAIENNVIYINQGSQWLGHSLTMLPSVEQFIIKTLHTLLNEYINAQAEETEYS